MANTKVVCLMLQRVGHRKLLEEDLTGRPFVSLQGRCECVEAMTGLSVSRSTMCRAIARLGPTRKKGDDRPPNGTSS